jgi:competence protein ComEA
MPRKRASEEIAERRAAMAESDRQNRRLFLLGIAAFAALTVVALIVRAVRSGPLDLNRASVEKLDTLPGIGPDTAKAIIKGRPYQSVDDLQKVKGIGPATIEKIRDKVKVSE